MTISIRRLLFGKPLETHELKHQRLNNFMALAVFSSDALSSVAYATEEIVIVLATAGAVGMNFTIPVALAIAALFSIVTLSYRQTVMAYPGGGGSYIVANDNLGQYPGLVAAGSLLTDYVLTVSVSIASGVAAITSAFPELYPYRIALCILCVTFITLANLRGVRESGALFSVPTYFFLLSITALIAVGLFDVVIAHKTVEYVAPPSPESILAPVTLFLLLRAFSSGCAALTGIEAISNGIPAFKPPESENARKTLTAMGIICIITFLGISVLAHVIHVTPRETETVISQIASFVFGKSFLYYCVQAGTATILIVAANTSFADFPRLSAILARASFMPRQMANLGDRLVFANGILFLGAISALLLAIFEGSTTRLIPLYAVGVFVSFTLSQAGMVVHWYKLRGPGWKKSIAINATGAIVTAVVAVVVAVTKFVHGAFIVIILIPVLVLVFRAINLHYRDVADSLRVGSSGKPDLSPLRNHVFLPISGITSVSLHALKFCFSISKDVTGLYVNVNRETTENIEGQIKRMKLPIPIKIIESPYRSVIGSLIEFINEETRRYPKDIITMVIPEFMPSKKWHYFLHNQTALMLYAAFRGHENVVITSVRKRV